MTLHPASSQIHIMFFGHNSFFPSSSPLANDKGEQFLLLNSFVYKTKLIFIRIINSIFYFIYAFDRARERFLLTFSSLCSSVTSKWVNRQQYQQQPWIKKGCHICEKFLALSLKRGTHREKLKKKRKLPMRKDLNSTINSSSFL